MPEGTPLRFRKLLGVLRRDDGSFEQWLVDPQLAPARVAKASVRLIDPHIALAQLLHSIERENRLIQGPRVADAYIAAMAIEHGCELITTDSDFARFPGLRWRHPLAAPR